MSKWTKYRVDEIAKKTGIGPFGSRMKSDTYTQSGVPVIRGTNITGGRSFSGEWVYVSERDADQLSSCNVREGDLVFPHRGSIGEVGIVPGDRERYLLSSSLMSLKCDETKADSLYLYYFFKSNEGRHQLLKNASQVGTPGIGQPLRSLRSIELYLPPVEQQKDIATMLGCLDDKIELNRRMNESLEAMARAIFQSWFVDFDPVRAKASGESVDSICQRLGLTPELLALFPDSFEDSELGEIPTGWLPTRLDNVLELAYGKALKATDRIVGEIPVYGSGGVTGYHHESLIDGPTIIVGRKGTVGSLYWEDRSSYPIDTVFYVKPKLELTYCLYLLQTLALETMNTDAAVPGLNRNNVYRLLTSLPDEKLRAAFNRLAMVVRSQMRAITEELKTLSEVRDTLLPTLLSGSLVVSARENLS